MVAPSKRNSDQIDQIRNEYITNLQSQVYFLELELNLMKQNQDLPNEECLKELQLLKKKHQIGDQTNINGGNINLSFLNKYITAILIITILLLLLLIFCICAYDSTQIKRISNTCY